MEKPTRPRVGCSPSQQTTPLKTPCIGNLSLAPRSDNRPLSAHVPVNTSFRQASADKPVLRAPHVLLDPKQSQPFKGEEGRVKGEGGEG